MARRGARPPARPLAPERRIPDVEDPGGDLVPADHETLVREAVALLSAFDRFSARQIGAIVQLGPEAVEAIREQPDVREAISTLRGLLPLPGDVDELLMSDAERNIRWLRDLRDGCVDGVRIGADPKTLRVRVDASKALLDRQVAKKVDVDLKAPRTIDITPAQRERMRVLLQGPLPAVPAPPEPPRPAPRAFTDAEFDPETPA